MSRWLCSNPSEAEGYGFEGNGSGTGRPVAVDFRTPATELEASEEPEDVLPYEQIRMFRWLFEQCVLREDGRIHVAAGIAMRMCCLASLLRLPPVDGMTLEQIANHCGVTRAAVSKVMLDLNAVTGMRSCHQRSDATRAVYRERAILVYERRKEAVFNCKSVT